MLKLKFIIREVCTLGNKPAIYGIAWNGTYGKLATCELHSYIRYSTNGS